MLQDSEHGFIFGLFGFIFCSKINKTHTNKDNINSIQCFSYIDRWCQLCIIIYPLLILIPHRLFQLTFSPMSTP